MRKTELRQQNELVRRTLGAVVLVLLSCFASASHALPIAVKPGLWERTVTTRVFETRTQVPELAKLPPDERAKAEAEMKRSVYAPDVTQTTRECVTSGAVASWAAFTGADRDYGACTRKTLAQNAKRFKASLVCNAGRSTGTSDYAADDDRISGETTLVFHESTYDRTERRLVKSRRIGSACGDAPVVVAPRAKQ
jgi:uncharacterized protein DUF3617